MLYNLYTASTCYLAAIMVLGSFHTLVARPTRPSTWKLHSQLVKFAHSRNFSLLCLVAAALLLISFNRYVSAICALFTLTVTVIGISFDHDGQCGCFGTKRKLSKQVTLLVRSLSLLASGLVISYILLDKDTSNMRFAWLRFAAATALFTYCIFQLRWGKSLQSAASLKEARDKDYIMWKPGQFVGFDSGGTPVHLVDLISSDKPLFLINLSENCPHCLALVPDMKNLAQVFADSITVVVIQQGRTLSEETTPYLSLVDPHRNIYTAVKAQGSPSAILLDSTTLKQVSPTAFGSDKVRILFALALNLIERTNMSAI